MTEWDKKNSMLSNIAHMIVFKLHLIQLTLLFYVVFLNNGMRKPSQRIQVLLIIFRKFLYFSPVLYS